MRNRTKKVILVVGLQLLIASVFIVGVSRTNYSLYILYHSYFADIFLPFGYYFLLSLPRFRHSLFNNWWVRGLSVFVLCATSETLQYFGIYALAKVFDPLDFVMYGIGVGLAILIDRQIFCRFLSFWNQE
jgi:hypothetical protein